MGTKNAGCKAFGLPIHVYHPKNRRMQLTPATLEVWQESNQWLAAKRKNEQGERRVAYRWPFNQSQRYCSS